MNISDQSSVNKFTGNTDVDLLIMEKLDDKELLRLCQVNRHLKELCKRELFWKKRFLNKFGNQFPKPEYRTWRRHYLLAISPPKTWNVTFGWFDSYDSSFMYYKLTRNAAEVMTVGDVTAAVIRENRIREYKPYTIYDMKTDKKISSKASASPYTDLQTMHYRG
jgi:hypothetical protein